MKITTSPEVDVLILLANVSPIVKLDGQVGFLALDNVGKRIRIAFKNPRRGGLRFIAAPDVARSVAPTAEEINGLLDPIPGDVANPHLAAYYDTHEYTGD